MIKSAFEYLVGLGNTRIETIGDQKFATQPLHPVKMATPATILVHSLSGLVEYLQSEFDGPDSLMVHVNSPTEVECFSNFNRDFARNRLIKAQAMLPEFSFERWLDPESFNIKLQSCFVPNFDREVMLKVVGNIKEDAVKTYGDDGVSQTVTAKTGVATMEQVVVPNPVVLAPYRTFVEVEQPASEFIFRMQSGPKCALFEADGGAWKLKAMQSIKDYLHVALDKEVDAGRLVIIA
ncbi:conserved hypothetical protein [Brevibacillus brevis NBRC 100599]|uniref:Uncharacterized protein n=1 Tax=Brevibacillus brevis (strain 47 / JCM 6285 / NBRC 100599) TaxID=358681 RepID=C0ZFI7_BREBN|nr:hypothetical protein [Brevibacillus brevis]BAH44546.1 conserved hypothetical protein [Brevibacillus brevis NBRC 100599]